MQVREPEAETVGTIPLHWGEIDSCTATKLSLRTQILEDMAALNPSASLGMLRELQQRAFVMDGWGKHRAAAWSGPSSTIIEDTGNMVIDETPR